jgi:hypothetical protein
MFDFLADGCAFFAVCVHEFVVQTGGGAISRESLGFEKGSVGG